MIGTLAWVSSRAWTQDRWWSLLSNPTVCTNIPLLTAGLDLKRLLCYFAFMGALITHIPNNCVNGFCKLVRRVLNVTLHIAGQRSSSSLRYLGEKKNLTSSPSLFFCLFILAANGVSLSEDGSWSHIYHFFACLAARQLLPALKTNRSGFLFFFNLFFSFFFLFFFFFFFFFFSFFFLFFFGLLLVCLFSSLLKITFDNS
jgi:hypothetical protein